MRLLTTNYLLLNKRSGFSLIEALIGIAVFLIIAMSAWQAFGVVLNGVKVLKIKSTSINIANEQIEIAHNLPYADVGIIGGLPVGKLPYIKTVQNINGDFEVTTTVRNIDLPFDGTIGGSPNDSSPADNKLVEVSVRCANGCGVPPVVLSTRIAPLALETTGNNGALFIQVFNSNGDPLEGANVRIENKLISPNIVINDVTGVNGMLQIVDAPPGIEAYEISVTKSGYSSDKTYKSGEQANPVPDKIHATVVGGGVTQVSFAIDKVSELTISSKNSACSAIGGFDFSMKGSKTIGLNKFKYDLSHVTNTSGNLSLDEIEWDSYMFSSVDSIYDIAGSNPISPLDLAPDTVQNIDLILRSKNPNALLIKVKDSATDLPVADAVVTIEKGSFSDTDNTGRGFLSQSDWSGGSGQSDFANETRYFSDNTNINTQSSVGEIKLVNFSGSYVSPGEITSSTFDVGTTTNFHTLEWLPGSQPPQAGNDSLKFQIATNIDNTEETVWNFVGPDGTANSYFTTSGQSMSSVHDGDRYLRYKAFLKTVDNNYTPSLSEFSFTFSSECTPSGQVFFSGLGAGNYKITVQKSGYQTFVADPVAVNSPWQDFEITLSP